MAAPTATAALSVEEEEAADEADEGELRSAGTVNLTNRQQSTLEG